MEILPGPGRVMRWGVPEGTRDPTTGNPSEAGALVHDDLVISAALCSLLDDQTWGLAISEVIPGFDPISSLGDVF